MGAVVAGGVYVVYTGQGRQAAWLGPLLACVATGVAIAVDEVQETHEVELVTVGAACCAMSLAGFGLHALYGPDKRALHGSVFLFPVILYVASRDTCGHVRVITFMNSCVHACWGGRAQGRPRLGHPPLPKHGVAARVCVPSRGDHVGSVGDGGHA